MALYVQCDICNEDLNEPGAIILDPPQERMVTKYHICAKCYLNIVLPALADAKENIRRGWEKKG